MQLYNVLSLALIATLGLVDALSIDFPASSTGDGYWVANATNTLNWRANATDPEYFSVQLLNSNSSSLNGNFQIANAISTANGSAQVYIDRVRCVVARTSRVWRRGQLTALSTPQIPPGSYTLLFVNASKYSLNKPQVFSTSLPFQVKPKGTQQADAKPYTSAFNHDGASSSSSSSSSSGSSASSSGAVNNDALNAANAAGNAANQSQNQNQQDAAMHELPTLRASVLFALVAAGVALLA